MSSPIVSQAATVQIARINVERLLVPVRGTSPLIVHKFSEKAKRQMLEAHIPTLRFRRGEAWPLAETPEAVRIAMIQRSEERLGRSPLPFGEVAVAKADGKDRPDPDDCDHTDFVVERDHLEDVPDGMFRETCLRCGFHRYQPESELPEALARLDAQAGPDLFAGDDEPAPVRPDDAPEVWVYGDDDEPQDDER